MRRFIQTLLISLFVGFSSLAYGAANDNLASVNDVSVYEGDSGTFTLTFTVTFTKNSTGSVDWALAHGTTNDADLDITQSGTLTLTSNSTSGTITVVAYGDTLYEADETFSIILSNPQGNVDGITDAIGIGTILNDDPYYLLSVSDASVYEGEPSDLTDMNFTLTLDNPMPVDVNIYYGTTDLTASAYSDYTPASSSVNYITLPAGTTTGTISIPIIGDDFDEPNERFTLTVSSLSGNIVIADGTAIGTILNDDNPVNTPPYLADVNFTIPESADINDTVGTLAATDDDGDTLTYSIISGNTGNTFDINATTGELFVAANLDYDTTSFYTLTVRVSDGNDSTTALVGIEVLEVLSDECNSFPRALNILGEVESELTINSVGVQINTPDHELMTYSNLLHDNSGTGSCYGTCIATGDKTHALNIPPFSNSSVNADTTCSTTNTPCTYPVSSVYDFGIMTVDSGAVATFETDPSNKQYRFQEWIINGTVMLEPGEYMANELTVSSTGNIVVLPGGDGSGVVRIYFYPTNASVTEASLGGNINLGGNPSQLVITAHKASLEFSGSMNGYLYAANGNVNILSNASLYGAATGRNIIVGSNAHINFDFPLINESIKLNGCFGSFNYYLYVNSATGPFAVYGDGENSGTTYNNYTKRINEPYTIDITHVDPDGNPQNLVLETSSNYDNRVSVSVIAKDGDTCDKSAIDPDDIGSINSRNDRVVVDFANGDQTHQVTGATIAHASQHMYYLVTSVDWASLTKAWYEAGIDCVNTSSSGGSLPGVPSCVSNENTLLQLGYGHCANPDPDEVAHRSPCDTSHERAQEGVCFDCIVGLEDFSFCSDNFAVRPKKFDLAVTDYNASNDLAAGEDLKLSLYGKDYADNAGTEYNQTIGSTFDVVTLDERNASGCVTETFEPNAIASQAGDLLTGATWHFTNGLYEQTSRYQNAGHVKFKIQEKENCADRFSYVDCDDTYPSAGDKDANTTIEPLDTALLFKPFDFEIYATLKDAGDDFTYLSNFEQYPTGDDRNMSARLDINITAKSQTDITTTNYNVACYANDSNITFSLTVGSATYPISPTNGLHKILVYDVANDTPDYNTTFPSVSPLTFPKDIRVENSSSAFKTDNNGTAEMKWRFNFDRNSSRPVNPFPLEVEDIDFEDNESVSGTKTLDDNVTFYYGRMHAPRYRVDQNLGVVLPMYFEIYSEEINPLVTAVSTGNLLSVDDIDWYQNTKHTDEDYGTTTGRYEPRNPAKWDQFDYLNDSNATFGQAVMTYDGSKGFPYKATINITPNSWLLYHRFNPFTLVNDFELEFNSQSGWVGQNRDNISVDSAASVNTNRRIEW